MKMIYELVTLEQRPDLGEQVRRLSREAWPEFLQHDQACARYWRFLFESFARFQLLLCQAGDLVIAVGHTIPVVWDGTREDLPSGIDGVLERGVHNAQDQRP